MPTGRYSGGANLHLIRMGVSYTVGSVQPDNMNEGDGPFCRDRGYDA